MKTKFFSSSASLLAGSLALLLAGCASYYPAPAGPTVIAPRPLYGPQAVVYGSTGGYRGAYVAGGANAGYAHTSAGGSAVWAGDSGRASTARGGSANWNNGSGSASSARGGSADWNNGSGSASGSRGGSASWGGGSSSWEGSRGRSGSGRR